MPSTSEVSKIIKLTSITVDSICLTMVFGNFVVDEAYDVGPNGSLEDGWKANWGIGCLVFFRVNGNLGTRRRQRLKSNVNSFYRH